MKIVITKEQYKTLVTSLLDNLIGNITIKTVKEKKEDGNKEDYHSVFDENGYQVMTIWIKGPLRSKGCKKDLTLENPLIEKFEKYMPYYRHKIFSEVLVDYIYDKFGIKCDCVQYDYNFEEEKHYDEDGDEYEYTSSKTRRYNVKKKKKIKESVDNSNIVERLLEMENIEIDFEYIDGRVLDDNELEEYIGTTVIDDDEIEDSLGGGAKIYIQEVYVHFYNNNNNELIINYHTSPTIYFITKNNKVIGVNSHNRFTDIATSFRYIPYKILNSYFIEGAKTYLEDFLSDGNNLNESVDKNKKLINKIIGFDFTGRIEQITSSYDVPMSFDECLYGESINRYLNFWGPMYLVDFGWTKMLYQDRGEFEWFMDEQCNDFVDNEIPEDLGISIMGLRFSDIINMYFQEED